MHASHELITSSEYLHVRVLLGMIVGLGLTHLLQNLALMIERPRHKQVYWVHLVWSLSVFLYLLSFWWWEFRLAHLQAWNFNLYLFVTLYALLLYLLCAIVFPKDVSDYADWETYFFARKSWFFSLLAMAYAADLVDTFIKGHDYFSSFGWEMPVRSAAYVILSLVAIATSNRTFHATFAVVGLLYQLAFIVRQFEVL
ncbi:MAG: hypothetical protein EOP02_06840 [Proteobacteria bacterium]|nr:MAG: hypothetical protein EOP02_06840 [Pseudomonadota bacterium]